MRNYMIRRVGHSIFIILGLMALLFFAINILGDPVELLVSEDASEEAVDAIRRSLGFDRPLYVRFGDFYWDLLRGDFGKSIRHRIDAREMIFDRLPNTAILAVIAWAIGSLGIPLGMLAARRPRPRASAQYPFVQAVVCTTVYDAPLLTLDRGNCRA